MRIIGLLVVLLPSSVRCTGVPWYPYILPIHTASNHQHTTHLVPHPIIHTKVVVLGEGGYHHHHPHHPAQNHLHHHGHYHAHGPEHVHFPTSRHPQSTFITNSVIFPKAASHNVHLRYNYPEDYSKFRYGFQKKGHHYSERDIKYSVPVEESPWKPITDIMKYVPKGYIPLNYLGLDAEKVASVVKHALNEIERDQEDRNSPRYPTGIQDLIGRPMKSSPAVFYDEDDPSGGWHGSINYPIRKKPTNKRSVNLNIKCNC